MGESSRSLLVSVGPTRRDLPLGFPRDSRVGPGKPTGSRLTMTACGSTEACKKAARGVLLMSCARSCTVSHLCPFVEHVEGGAVGALRSHRPTQPDGQRPPPPLCYRRRLLTHFPQVIRSAQVYTLSLSLSLPSLFPFSFTLQALRPNPNTTMAAIIKTTLLNRTVGVVTGASPLPFLPSQLTSLRRCFGYRCSCSRVLCCSWSARHLCCRHQGSHQHGPQG